MSNDETAARLKALEARLADLERSVYGPARWHAPAAPAPDASPLAKPTAAAAPPPPRPPAPTPVSAAAPWRAPVTPPAGRVSAGEDRGSDSLVTNALGWGGAVALVLAAAYFIRLGIDAGWLTPAVQVGSAAVFGSVLIGVGFGFRASDRRYAALLPAAGVAILFLSIYGAHLLYHLTSANQAIVALVVVCAGSLGLCVAFDSDLYALFAVAGSYSAPFLLKDASGVFGEIALYYSAWSLTFTIFAIARARRLVYLLALYVALLGFDILARRHEVDWRLLLEFQTIQFFIFGVGAVIASIRRREPMDEGVAMVHLPALLLFYALQYVLLKTHVPGLAPWIAVGSLLVLLVLYAIVTTALKRSSPGGQLLLGSYAALVLFHAGYLESVPAAAGPWVALGLLALAFASRRWWEAAGVGLRPLLLAVGVTFVINFVRVVTGTHLDSVPAHKTLGLLYAAMLYLGYVLTRREPRQAGFSGPLLYVGHLTAMSAILQLVSERILQSVAWGLLALGCMAWALARRERVVGQSSLLIFAATAVKVMLYDLEGAAPLPRIASLVALGITFFVAGLFYRNLARSDTAREANA
ncbi:MAG TPA: DUF2339 domain-containing protein [Steroidobacteraceae bacterium]|nr:DUF2339 domain-containing protein [Steroidobacteraceae bacterium]